MGPFLLWVAAPPPEFRFVHLSMHSVPQASSIFMHLAFREICARFSGMSQVRSLSESRRIQNSRSVSACDPKRTSNRDAHCRLEPTQLLLPWLWLRCWLQHLLLVLNNRIATANLSSPHKFFSLRQMAIYQLVASMVPLTQV